MHIVDKLIEAGWNPIADMKGELLAFDLEMINYVDDDCSFQEASAYMDYFEIVNLRDSCLSIANYVKMRINTAHEDGLNENIYDVY